MASLNLTLSTSDYSASTLTSTFEQVGQQQTIMRRLETLLARLNGGNSSGTFTISVLDNQGFAAGTITAASVQAGDTVTVGATTVTAHATITDSTRFALGASDTACAANLATCLGLNATVAAQVSASATSGVCTITSLVGGVIGNALNLASSNNTRLAKVAFSGGSADATALTYTF